MPGDGFQLRILESVLKMAGHRSTECLFKFLIQLNTTRSASYTIWHERRKSGARAAQEQRRSGNRWEVTE